MSAWCRASPTAPCRACARCSSMKTRRRWARSPAPRSAAFSAARSVTANIVAPLADAEPHFAPHAEHFEPHFEPHHEPHPEFGPHVRFDDHFHHDHFYPALGFAMAALPLGYLTVHGFDGDYYFHAGV